MIKKSIVVIGLVVIMGSSLFGDGPTIKQTQDFINKVIKSDELSSKSEGYKKPIFQFNEGNEGCKAKVIESWAADKDNSAGRNRYIVDFSKQNAYYDYESSSKYHKIKIEDINKVSTIYVYKYGKKTNLSSLNIYMKVHGIYKEKFDKALKHLSKLCYDKYGVENDDPF